MIKTKIDAITGLRGLAALMVVYAHAVSWFSLPLKINFSGEIGVMIFFSLSGFLMAYLYIGKKFSALDVTNYAISRFSRIAPAYLFILFLSYIIYTNIDPNFIYDISSKNILRHILFSGNVSVFWSITPEVEFYFLFVIIWAAASRYLMKFDVVGILFLVIGSVLILSYRDIFPGTFIGGKLHYFLFGVIAGVIRSKIKNEQDKTSITILHIVLIALMILMESGLLPLPFLNNAEFYSSILTAVVGAVLVFSFTFPSVIAKFLFENKFIIFCGECSFSIYLLHMPVIYLFQRLLPEQSNDLVSISLQILFLITFSLIVLIVSWLNFHLIEKPGARLIKTMGNSLKKKLFPLIPMASNAHPKSVKVMKDEKNLLKSDA